jgi:hypothetical protein
LRKQFDPDPALRLPDKLENIIGGAFDDFDSEDLYSANAAESDNFTVDGMNGGTACTAQMRFRPAKTSGRVKKSDLKAPGLVMARIDNQTPGCTPTGIYSIIPGGHAAAIVARGKSSGFEARLAQFGGTELKTMTFEFCGHNQNHSTDLVKRYTYSSGETPCGKSLAAHPTTSSDGSEGEPGAQPPVQGSKEIAWISCSNDCCPSSAPPDTGMANLRVPRPTTIVGQILR